MSANTALPMTMPSAMPTTLSTAAICAFSRAYHAKMGGQVFNDYLAYDLIGEDNYQIIHERIENEPVFGPLSVGDVMTEYLDPILLSRAQFAESELADFAAAHENVQYVICGAGFDTFAFRNDNPNIKVFEIDQPKMRAQKLARIAKLGWDIPGNVSFVPVDFEHDDLTQQLLNAGFDAKQKTFFSILGVTYYLPLPVFATTIDKISKLSAPGSKLVFDYPDQHLHAGAVGRVGGERRDGELGRVATLAQFAATVGERMRGGYSLAALRSVLDAKGMEVVEYFAPQQIEKQFLNGTGGLQYKAFDNVHFMLSSLKER